MRLPQATAAPRLSTPVMSSHSSGNSFWRPECRFDETLPLWLALPETKLPELLAELGLPGFCACCAGGSSCGNMAHSLGGGVSEPTCGTSKPERWMLQFGGLANAAHETKSAAKLSAANVNFVTRTRNFISA